jgi:hypothetical protein
MKYTIAYTDKGSIMIPDKEIIKDCHGYTYEALRGYAHTLAVFDSDNKCIGWTMVESFGFNNVKEWKEIFG